MSAKPTPMTLAAARVLCKQHAKLTNTDADDCWAIYHRSFVEDAEKALEAAGVPELLKALLRFVAAAEGPRFAIFPDDYESELDTARAAIARAEGTA